MIRNTDTARVIIGLGPYCEKWTVSEKRQYSNWAITHIHTIGEQITHVNYNAMFPSQLASRIFQEDDSKDCFFKTEFYLFINGIYFTEIFKKLHNANM